MGGVLKMKPLAGQLSLAGCGHAPVRLLLQRQADATLRPGKPQQPCDLGLFSDDAAQADLVDMARRGLTLGRITSE
jgi:hypothetical protein